MEQRSFVHSLIKVLRKSTVPMHGNLLHATLKKGISCIQRVYFDQSWITVVHSDSFRINIAIADMHRLIASIFDVSNYFQNTNFPTHEILCVSLPSYYLYWFKNLNPMFLSIYIMFHFVLNAWIEFREQCQPDNNFIDSLM